MSDPLVGRQFGNVRLTAKIGAGAMGMVYRAHHERFAKEVAVKLLKPGAGGGSYRERFLREGRAAAMIQHEHVVQVMDAGEIQGMAYLVLELVIGHSLGDILDDLKKQSGSPWLANDVVTHLGTGIALGLAAIHAKGIVHRDIKPDNILVGADRRAKITDLGLAKQLDDPDLNRLTGTGFVVGTPLYVSPEGIRDPQSITAKADVYSLGATLYHLLTGQPPFAATTPYEVMRAHLEDRPRPVRELNPAVPAGLAQLVERCLAKAPEQRPTANELADMLSRGSALKARTSTGLILTMVAAFVVVGAGGVATWMVLRPEPTASSASLAQGRLVLRAAEPAELQLDDGPWQQVPAEGIAAPIGSHRLAVRSTTPGELRLFRGSASIADLASGPTIVAADLASVAVPPVTATLAGGGMLFVEGQAYGLDPRASLSTAGRFVLGRFDGDRWLAQELRIAEDGSQHTEPASTATKPAGRGFWRSRDRDGALASPHHVACWWLADLARSRTGLPAPPGWDAQGLRPEQPALRCPPALVDAIATLVAARLPTRGEATRLATAWRAPVWYADGGRLDVVGGHPGQALTIVVP